VAPLSARSFDHRLRGEVGDRHAVLLKRRLEAELVDRSDHPGRELNPHILLLARDINPAGLKVRHEHVVGLIVRMANAVAVLPGAARNLALVRHITT